MRGTVARQRSMQTMRVEWLLCDQRTLSTMPPMCTHLTMRIMLRLSSFPEAALATESTTTTKSMTSTGELR